MNHYKLEPDRVQASVEGCAQQAAGRPLSLDEAMDQHDGLVRAFVQRQGGGDLSYEGALQAGRIGLWRAIRGYDPSRGFAFSTYAWVAISRTIRRADKENDHTPSLCLGGLREQSYTLDLEAWVDRILIYRALHDLVAQLPQRQRQIIAARYGLIGASVRQLDEVGSELGLTGERVRQLQQEALAWMRHPAHSVRLRSLADKNSARDYRQALRQNAALLRKRSGRT